eukprot:CAMPEP_0176196962 /NCGR_PEP_ID=MMETSP0121_2-20121125/7296_1 /TAXON_ID=160619 /ORGANISM="Kryptoperidinium foliaceum, Strain CCMP 1326" /LENGTH=58 /DNA_ID=CAMNT_0017535775 /DNA_START=211 /DNA_END=387 /DNA_ORIENTATION=+
MPSFDSSTVLKKRDCVFSSLLTDAPVLRMIFIASAWATCSPAASLQFTPRNGTDSMGQ